MRQSQLKGLEIKGLAFSYEDSPVLGQLNLSLDAGKFGSIMGASGVGKSTLLRVITGFLEPQAGTVSHNGHSPSQLRDSGSVSMMFQDDRLLEWLTVQENIEVAIAAGRHWSGALDIGALLDDVGLLGLDGRFPRDLSGGMRQRVALCRALVRQPGLLLLDEPFGAVDVRTRERLTILLQRLLATKVTTVLQVTHSPEEAVILSDKIYVLAGNPASVFAAVDNTPIDQSKGEAYLMSGFHERVGELRHLLKRAELQNAV